MTIMQNIIALAERIASELRLKQSTTEKSKPGGYAAIDESGFVPMSELNLEEINKALPFVSNITRGSIGVSEQDLQVKLKVKNYDSTLDTLIFTDPNGDNIPTRNITLNKNKTVITSTITVPKIPGVISIGFVRYNQSFYSEKSIKIVIDNWIKFSSGNDLPTIDIKAGTVSQDSKGLNITGGDSWGNYVLFPDFQWQRAENQTVEFIWYFDNNNSSRWMFGIGSDEVDKNSSQQYYQGEQLLYLSGQSSTSYYGGGPNSNFSESANVDWPDAGYYKFKWLDNGLTMIVYQVNSDVASWEDESTEISRVSLVRGDNSADATNLMAMLVVPSYLAGSRFTAYREVE